MMGVTHFALGAVGSRAFRPWWLKLLWLPLAFLSHTLLESLPLYHPVGGWWVSISMVAINLLLFIIFLRYIGKDYWAWLAGLVAWLGMDYEHILIWLGWQQGYFWHSAQRRLWLGNLNGEGILIEGGLLLGLFLMLRLEKPLRRQN